MEIVLTSLASLSHKFWDQINILIQNIDPTLSQKLSHKVFWFCLTESDMMPAVCCVSDIDGVCICLHHTSKVWNKYLFCFFQDQRELSVSGDLATLPPPDHRSQSIHSALAKSASHSSAVWWNKLGKMFIVPFLTLSFCLDYFECSIRSKM